ncbi:MAG TPA: fasciclin domain-containing protein, partial [Ilumatobacter sp.]|nr:fasciclin domain-containing protein [Ilumatobacter sp.]
MNHTLTLRRSRPTRRLAATLAVAGLALTAAACGDDAADTPVATQPPTDPVTTEPIATQPPSTEPMTTEPMTTEPATGMEPSGAGCAAVPTDGEGSFSGMADDPAATAASNNPVLSTLVGAVVQAGLVDTLNSDGPFTIFAPTNDA